MIDQQLERRDSGGNRGCGGWRRRFEVEVEVEVEWRGLGTWDGEAAAAGDLFGGFFPFLSSRLLLSPSLSFAVRFAWPIPRLPTDPCLFDWLIQPSHGSRAYHPSRPTPHDPTAATCVPVAAASSASTSFFFCLGLIARLLSGGGVI